MWRLLWEEARLSACTYIVCETLHSDKPYVFFESKLFTRMLAGIGILNFR